MDADTIDLDDWDGVYYDAQYGDFLRVERVDGDLALVDTQTGDPFHTFDNPEAFRDAAREFHPVSERAVDDPVDLVDRFINEALNQKTGRADSIDLQYALEVTEVVEATADE